MDRIVAFRCKNCGRLEHADNAGDNDYPHACSVCGSGVVLSPGVDEIAKKLSSPDCTHEDRVKFADELRIIARQGSGTKTITPSNWEILAHCKPERLKELGLEPHHVCKHVPKTPSKPRLSIVIPVHGSETVGVDNASKQENTGDLAIFKPEL